MLLLTCSSADNVLTMVGVFKSGRPELDCAEVDIASDRIDPAFVFHPSPGDGYSCSNKLACLATSTKWSSCGIRASSEFESIIRHIGTFLLQVAH